MPTVPNPSYHPSSPNQQRVDMGLPPMSGGGSYTAPAEVPVSRPTYVQGQGYVATTFGTGGRPASIFSGTPPKYYYTGGLVAVQAESQKAQDAQRALAQQNVAAQREALQRDANYYLSTGSLTEAAVAASQGNLPPGVIIPFQTEPAKETFWQKITDVWQSAAGIGPFTPIKYGQIGTLVPVGSGEQYLSSIPKQQNILNIFTPESKVGYFVKPLAALLGKEGQVLVSEFAPNIENLRFIQSQRAQSSQLSMTAANQQIAMEQFSANLQTLQMRNISGTQEYSDILSANIGYLKSSGIGVTSSTSDIISSVPNALGGLDTTTQTMTTYNIKQPEQLVSPSVAIEQYLTESGASQFKILSFEAGGVATKAISTVEAGLAVVLGLEFLGVPAALEYIGVSVPGRIVSAAARISPEFALTSVRIFEGVGSVAPKVITAGVVGLSALDIGMTAFESAQEYSTAGLSSTRGAIVGGITEAAGVAGLFVGLSKGELSPLKIQPIVTSMETGETSVYSLGIVNPFGKAATSGKALLTYSEKEGFSLGSFKPLESPSFLAGGELQANTQLGLQVLKETIPKVTNVKQATELFSIEESALPKAFRLQSPGQSIIDISQTKWYPEMTSAEQKITTKFFTDLGKGSGEFTFKGLGSVIKESSFGGLFSTGEPAALERAFGSLTIKAEKGITRLAGDIDFNVYGKAIPKVENLFKQFEKVSPGRFSLEGGQLSFKGEKIIEGFGKDIPSIVQRPLGYKSMFPKSMKLSTGGDIAGQKFGESLVQKFSTALTIKGTPEGLVLGPRAGQEKVLPDIYKMLGRASELSPKSSGELKALQTRFGKLAVEMNPAIDLKSGTIGGGKPLAKGYTFGVSSFAPGVSSISKSQRTSFSMPSSKSIVSSLSSSSLGSLSLSYSKSSVSSSSFPSLSSLSSRSSVSSISSVSSLSSVSSMSSKSSKSSMSSMGSAFKFSGFGLPEMPSLGGYAAPIKKTRGKKSPFDIAPSFTGIIENIKMTSPLKVSRSLGVTPFQTRGLLTGKKRKGAYFKLVDF